MVETLGFVGTLCFTISNIILVAAVVRARSTDLPWLTIGLIMTGAALMCLYGIAIGSRPVVIDMGICFSCWAIVGTVKYLDWR